MPLATLARTERRAERRALAIGAPRTPILGLLWPSAPLGNFRVGFGFLDADFASSPAETTSAMGTTKPARTLYSVDLFAGAGGLTKGFHDSGFHPLAANDFDDDAGKTFEANFRETPFIPGSISEITGRMFLDIAGLRAGELDTLLGGPPCQAFSVYNHQRGFHDERSGLFREYLRVVEALEPRVVVMENVTGMTQLGGGRAIDEIYQRLDARGYHVEHRILRAEDYGVPQERRRLFIIGSRVGPIIWPKVSHGDPADLLSQHLKPFVTVDDAISDLPALEVGEGTEEAQSYASEPRSEFQRQMRRASHAVFNHVAPYLAPVNLERMKYIPPGGSWRDIPVRLLPAGMKLAKRSDHTKRYGRLDPAGQFSTILTKADPHWGAYIHPKQDRTLTARECARAQSFPDDFIFAGSRGEQFRQIGNAVPPLLATRVADCVREMIELSARSEGRNRRSDFVRSA